MSPLADPVRSPDRLRRSLVTSRHRGPRALLLAPALAGLAGLSLLVSACGGSSSPHVAAIGTPASTRSATTSDSTSPDGSTRLRTALAFSRCMRSHGVPSFPDPDSQGSFPSFDAGVSKQTSAAANDTCKRLLASEGTATPQQRHQKLAFGAKVAQCLRAHGYPGFPDPTALGSQSLPPGIDASSPQFQSTETTCENHVRKALGLP